MVRYGIYVGKQSDDNRTKKPVWKWYLAKTTSTPPDDLTIITIIRKEKGARGYAMNLTVKPWKKVSRTVIID